MQAMTSIGLEPSLYLLKLVESNIVHQIHLNANQCQREPITDPKTIDLDKKTHPVVTILNDRSQEPISLTYFEDIDLKIHFTILSSTQPNPDGTYKQSLITSTSFVFCPPPTSPVETPSCCNWPDTMKYEQKYGVENYPPSTPWICTRLHNVLTPALPISLIPLTIPIHAELLRWSSAGNPSALNNRFYPSANGTTQLREPAEYLYGMSQNLSSLKLSNVAQLDETLPQFRYQPQVRNVRKPFNYTQLTRTPAHEIEILENQESNLSPAQRLHLDSVRREFHPDHKVNQTNPEFHIGDDFYQDQSLDANKLDLTNTSVEGPLVPRLQAKDKQPGTVAEQFNETPASSSAIAQASADSRSGPSMPTDPDPSIRATSTLPVVSIESDSIITTRGQKQAENLPNDTKYIDFLLELKNLVCTWSLSSI